MNDCLNEISKEIPNGNDEIDENAAIGIQSKEIYAIDDSTLPGVKVHKHVFERNENISNKLFYRSLNIEFDVFNDSFDITQGQVQVLELFIGIELFVQQVQFVIITIRFLQRMQQ